jgi:hypothetical protein|tara:strand:+ start:483 stop:785 length:303 start_codon:yes stop_codon:yes gene_type:complete
MSGPYIIPATGSKYNVFERLGHPGKYYGIKTVNNATVDFTGSNYGYGAVMVGESSATGTILTSGGGSVNIAHLTVGTIYELSPAKITVNAKTVYALKRQQ